VYERPGKDPDEEPRVVWTHPIEGPLAGVRVVGTVGNAICVRVERVTQQTAIAVEREALCVEAGTGSVLAKRALGRPGLYTMHEDLAVGGAPAVLAFARPEADGLVLERIALQVDDGAPGRDERAVGHDGAASGPKPQGETTEVTQ
jgi:hypothetical protein